MEAWREELYHYGIKGQRWGTRRWQNEDGSFNSAGKQRYFGNGAGENYKPVGKGLNKPTGRSLKGNIHRALAKNYELNEKAYAKSNKSISSMNKAAKEEQLKKAETADKAKAAKIEVKKQAVKEYNKAYDEHGKALKENEAAVREMQDAYKALGKTYIGRIREAYRGSIGKGSEAYKKYSKAYDKVDSTYEKTVETSKKMKEAYAKTGKNLIDRFISNAKYDTHAWDDYKKDR